ncbi:hypothetical protein GCM10010340_69360 [Streptomyces griseoloalbus]|nr:hypothetical protein GCM10010294_69470 [Streptomyces griseoloalbus]GGW81388.1 hypothetical protein GCM10010340_69360 [Streptomyces albaduncus]
MPGSPPPLLAPFPEPRHHRPLIGRAVTAATTILLSGTGLALWTQGASSWALLFGMLTVAGFLGLLTATLLGRTLIAVTVRGSSMLPAFREGDRVLVRRGVLPAVGQVVVVEQPMPGPQWDTSPLPRTAGALAVSRREWLFKRVAACAGDPVPLRAVPSSARDECVPQGQLVLLGDNARISFDSRQVGYFPSERVLGTVVRTLSP